MRTFRFGVTASHAGSGEAWAALARRAEELGYGALLVPDHLSQQLSPIAAIATAAAATTTLRVGGFVFANDFRHPLMLAREAATLDLLSNGRLELGLGAGWRTSDYRQLGMPYDAPGRRIDRLVESSLLVKRLLSGETVTHAGPHYQLGAARVWPRPIQRPHPPIIMGGGGPRMLRLAAREADIVGFIPQFSQRGRPILTDVGETALDRKVAIVREAAGDRFERLELNLFIVDAGMVGSGQPVARSVMAAAKVASVGLAGSPYFLYGTLPALRERLERRRERTTISYYAIRQGSMEAMAPLVTALAGR
ncbi:MAG TPA: TIGR03621 family F420-dependent LLM class oxidoreductase [Candidatus Limnocylindria bacterium]|nr:TIGR03621 family F420-dependent LLM class oxidoreductase [Candidatus Limnocylindria bacterium]